MTITIDVLKADGAKVGRGIPVPFALALALAALRSVWGHRGDCVACDGRPRLWG